jgi:fatty acid desaturase
MTDSGVWRDEETRTVRPRWTWIAWAVLLLGVLIIGWAVIVGSWAWVVPGVVALVVGGVLAVYGGFFYDVQGGASVKAQVRDIAEDAQHEFPVAGSTRSEAEVKRDVRRRWLGHRE